MADIEEVLHFALTKTFTVLTDLGFTINYDKSSLVPSQEVCFLGFLINSITMLVIMTPSKGTKTGLGRSNITKQTVSHYKGGSGGSRGWTGWPITHPSGRPDPHVGHDITEFVGNSLQDKKRYLSQFPDRQQRRATQLLEQA